MSGPWEDFQSGPWDEFKKQTVEDPGAAQAALIGAGRMADKTVAGLKQIYYGLTGNEAAQNELKQQQSENDKIYGGLQSKRPYSTLAGEIAPLALGVPAVSGIGTAALVNAIPGAIQYGSPQERALNAGIGGAGGAAGAALGAGIAKAFGPASMDAANAANKWGIPTRVAQNTDSKPVQVIDAVLQNLPFSSSVLNKAKDASYQGFNKAVADTFGENATNLSPALLGSARQRIGSEIGNIANRSTLTVDQQLAQDLARISQDAQKSVVGNPLELTNKWVKNVVEAIDPNTGTIPGTVYRSLQSEMGKAAKNNPGDASRWIGELRDSVRSAMDRSISSADADAWKLANKQYFNLNQVADAVKSTPGSISPAQLLQSVNRSQRASKFGGGNDLAELAQWAKVKMPDTIPNSGTAQRMLYQQILTNPLTPLAALGGGMAGAHQMGIPPENAAVGLLTPYLVARAMSGKPVAGSTKYLLEGLGGLLGYGGANAALR